MLARASLIALALTSPAWGGPDDYPAGLFERSPLNDTPAAVSHGSRKSPRASEKPGQRARQRRMSSLPRLELSVAATMLTRYSNVELAGCAEREVHKRRLVSRRLVRSCR